MSMRKYGAGRRRHYIVIQSKHNSQNDYGEIETVWEDDFNTFADIQSIRSKEYYQARQVQSIVSHKIYFKYQSLENGNDITPNNSRIVFNNRIFNIDSVINIDERNIDLEIMAVEEL